MRDIHTEARRLADIKSGKGEGEKGGLSVGPDGDEKSSEKVEGSEEKGEKHTATGPAADIAAATDVAPLGEKS